MFKRAGGQSKISPFNDGMRFILIVFRMITLFAPMKVFFPTSITFVMLGILYTAFDIVFVSGTVACSKYGRTARDDGHFDFSHRSRFGTNRGIAL